jgi:hypothetical protein
VRLVIQSVSQSVSQSVRLVREGTGKSAVGQVVSQAN